MGRASVKRRKEKPQIRETLFFDEALMAKYGKVW